MSDRYVIDKTSLTAIADAIRAKYPEGTSGHTTKWCPKPTSSVSMADAIANIPGGGLDWDAVAMRNFTGVVSLSNENTVSQIKSYAFQGSKITSISAPKVTSIGDRAFQGCTNLESVSMPELEYTSDYSNIFSNCSALVSVSMPKLISMGANMFSMSGITSLSLPSLVTLTANALADARSLTDIDFPTLRTINQKAFSNCWGLTNIWLPITTTIDANAFVGCSNLRMVRMGAKPAGMPVMSISSLAFSRLTGITDIYVAWSEGEVANAPWGATNATIHYDTDFNADGTINIYEG